MWTECKNAIPSVLNPICIDLSSNHVLIFEFLPLQDLTAHNDIVDGDVDEFDKETDETHDGKSNSCCHGDLLELFSIWLCASFYESDRVFNELSARFNELHYLIHDVWAVSREKQKH